MALLSLAHLTALDATPLELVDAAVAGGFQAIGLRLVWNGAAPKVDLVADPAARRETRARLAETGIGLLDVEAFLLGPSPDFNLFERALATAAQLGASRLLAAGRDPDEGRFLAHFVRLADLAAGYGIRVGLEFISYFEVATLADARRLLGLANHPNTGLLLDAIHLSRSGGSPEDLAGLTLADYAYAQICDGRAAIPAAPEDRAREARTDRLPVGEGDLWLDRLLDVLPPDLPLGVEAPVVAHAGLPVIERGRLAGRALHAFLGRRRERP